MAILSSGHQAQSVAGGQTFSSGLIFNIFETTFDWKWKEDHTDVFLLVDGFCPISACFFFQTRYLDLCCLRSGVDLAGLLTLHRCGRERQLALHISSASRQVWRSTLSMAQTAGEDGRT